MSTELPTPSTPNGISADAQSEVEGLAGGGVSGIVEWLKRIPVVGTTAHVGGVIIGYGLFNVLGLGFERLVAYPLFKWQMGTTAYGDLGLALGNVTLLVMVASAGQSLSVFRFHSWRTAEQKQGLYVTGFWTTVVVALVLGGTLFGASYWREGAMGGPVAASFVRWLIPMLVATAIVRYLCALLRADMKIILSAGLANLPQMISLVGLLFVSWMGANAVPWGISLASMVGVVVLMVVVVRKKVVSNWLTWSKEEFKAIVKTGPVFALSSICASLVILNGRWFLDYYWTKDDIAYYWIACGNAAMAVVPISLGSTAIVPIICAKARLSDFNRKAIRLYYVVSVVMAVGVFLGGWFVARPLLILYRRDAVQHCPELVFYLLIGFAISVFMEVYVGFLHKFHSPWTQLGMYVAAVGINVGMNVLLVPKYGALGAAWSAAAALSFKGIVAFVLMTKTFFSRAAAREEAVGQPSQGGP